MKVLKSYEFARKAAASKYPWDILLDGQCREMEPADFGPEGMPKAFPAAVRKQAKARGLTVKVQKTEEGGVVIQAFKADAEEGADAAEGKAAKGKGKK